MWLFTKRGYFSVVQDRQNAGKLHIRARFREDLENLRDDYLQDLEIVHTPRADYAYRAQLDRVSFTELAAALANDVDYDNFKNAVTREQGHDRHMLYLDVWHTMCAAQDEAERRRLAGVNRLNARKRSATTTFPLPPDECGTLPCPECHKPAGSQHLGWCSHNVGNGQVVVGPFTVERSPGRTVSIEAVESENGELFGHFAVTRCDECDQPSGARHLEGCRNDGAGEPVRGGIQGSFVDAAQLPKLKRAINQAFTARSADWTRGKRLRDELDQKNKKKAAKKNAKARKRSRRK